MNCCEKTKKEKKEKGFLKGLLYGLAPHTFCILFILFSVFGATTAITLLKPLLLNPYFFYILIAISLIFATFSAVFYFKQQGFINLSRISDGLEISFLPSGLKRKWKYLLTLYGTTISVNLLFFMVIFPKVANLNLNPTSQTAALVEKTNPIRNLNSNGAGLSSITLKVDIPCPGHAPLITTELKKIDGVEEVKFSFPNLFDVKYNFLKTSKEKILSLEVFNTYKATVINEQKGEVAEQSINNPGITQPLTGGCGCGCGRR